MAKRRRSTGNSEGGRKLLINASESEESRIAILKDGKLDEYYIERQSLGSTLGNIYKARVTNVEKSIGASFVEFGHHRQGFLHVSDLCMEAVGGDAAELLVSVQAAREVAHDEDVVERRPAAKAADSSEKAGGDGQHESAEGGAEKAASSVTALAVAEADETAVVEGKGPSSEAGKVSADSSDGEAGDEDGSDTGEYSPDEVVDPWTGDALQEERGQELRVVQDADGDDEEELPELELELIEHDDDEESAGEGDAQPEASSGAGVSQSAGDEQAAGGDSATESAVDTTAENAADEEDFSARLELFGPLNEELEALRLKAEDELPQRGGRRRGRRGRGRGGRGRRSENDQGQKIAPPSQSDSGDSRRGPAKDQSSSKGRARKSRDQREMPAIEEILHKGQEVVVQVIKDGIGNKGPTLTTFLSIPGRFIVLMPGIHKRGVSRKVSDSKERDRLKDLVRDLKAPDGVGFIVRTAGLGFSIEDLQRDLDYLLRLWSQMRVRVKEHAAPVLLYQENDLVIRTLRDLYDGRGEVIIDDPVTAGKAREFMSQIMPDCIDKVVSYKNEKPLFSHYGLETELQRLLKSRLELKSGASLIIEQTEALVAVDVNSGRYKPEKHKSIDDTAFNVNCEAAVEVARQLRLRDLGGVVVIDFIDMRLEKHRKALERLFKDELRKDRARIKVARVSPFGILEMTRQRVRPSLKRSVHQGCPYCEGTGYVPSDETSCLGVVRTIRDNLWRPGTVLVVTVRPEVAEAVLNTQKRILAEIEERHHRQIFIRADHRLAYDDIEIRAMVALPSEMDHRRA
ncbi:MAG: ribonuclease E [Pseudohongiellaceae bacterium]|jgi:ribonuclease E